MSAGTSCKGQSKSECKAQIWDDQLCWELHMPSCTVASYRKCTKKECHCRASYAAYMLRQASHAVQNISPVCCCTAQCGIPPVGQRAALWVRHIAAEL